LKGNMKYFIAIGSTVLAIVYLMKFFFVQGDGTLAVFAIHFFIAFFAWTVIAVERDL